MRVLFLALLAFGCDDVPSDAPGARQAGSAGASADVTHPNPDWPARIADALDAAYGGGGVGSANVGPGAVAEYVHVMPADDHVVYVTSGAHRSRFPHELTMRIRFDEPPTDERLWQVAPVWPQRVLAELARVEGSSPRPFAPGNHIRNVRLDDIPYRHFAFVRDPVLRDLRAAGAEEPLVFVQVVPLTDEQLRAIDAIPTGAVNTVLRDWAARDPLLRVDDR